MVIKNWLAESLIYAAVSGTLISMKGKRRLPNKSKLTDSGRLTEGAKRALESVRMDFENRIVHKAEENMLSENRTEISEGDIQKAVKTVRLATNSGRNWVMRTGTLLGFAVLLSHFVAFSELPNISPTLLFRLYFPTVVMLLWMCLFAFYYKDDFL